MTCMCIAFANGRKENAVTKRKVCCMTACLHVVCILSFVGAHCPKDFLSFFLSLPISLSLSLFLPLSGLMFVGTTMVFVGTTPWWLKCVANSTKITHSERLLLGVFNYDDHCTVVDVIHGRLIYA